MFNVTNVVSLGFSGRKATAKYWSAMAAQSNGPGSGLAANDPFLAAQKAAGVPQALRSTLPFCSQSTLLARKDGRRDLVAQAAGPLRKSLHSLSAAGNFGFNVQDVAFIRTRNDLADRHVTI